MTVRSATREEVPQIARLVHSLAHFYLDDAQTTLPEWFAETLSLSSFVTRVTSPEYRNWVYEVDGLVVGYIALKGESHLYHLFVAEEQQGKGIAKALWESAVRGSSANAFTVRSSLFAVPVYKRFGFVASGPVGTKDGISFQPMALTL